MYNKCLYRLSAQGICSLVDLTMIRPIEKKLVEKIASGQVIIDLPSALKELVENSIDAEATTIGFTFSSYTEMVSLLSISFARYFSLE